MAGRRSARPPRQHRVRTAASGTESGTNASREAAASTAGWQARLSDTSRDGTGAPMTDPDPVPQISTIQIQDPLDCSDRQYDGADGACPSAGCGCGCACHGVSAPAAAARAAAASRAHGGGGVDAVSAERPSGSLHRSVHRRRHPGRRAVPGAGPRVRGGCWCAIRGSGGPPSISHPPRCNRP